MSSPVITASRKVWIQPFTGLSPAQFRKLVRLVAERGGPEISDGRPGRQWALELPDRVLLVATYWRTNLTMRQLGPLEVRRPSTGEACLVDTRISTAIAKHVQRIG